jgi:hypothetical protein
MTPFVVASWLLLSSSGDPVDTPRGSPSGAQVGSPLPPPSAPPAQRKAKTSAADTTAPAPPPLARVGGGDLLFSRDEPALAAARRAVDAGDADLAVDRAREAVAATPDERAVVEYDAAQALRARARKDASTTAQRDGSGGAAPAPAPPAPPASPNLEEAIASFERAAGLSVNPRLKSEALLAAGNAALEAGKLEDAIPSLRKALVADPNNDRARRNLQRALQAKAAAPPPSDGEPGDGDDEQKKNDDPKSGDENEDDSQGSQAGQPPGGAKNDHDGREKSDKAHPEKDPKPGEKSQDEAGGESRGEPQSGPDPKTDGSPSDGQPGVAPSPNAHDDEAGPKDESAAKNQAGAPPSRASKKTSKDEKRRLLEGLRSRERPLTPWEMRGVERKNAREGKDW